MSPKRRVPQYMSPSSLATYEDDNTEYYLKYCAANRPDKMPQTAPMSVGSAFDAYAKSYLYRCLIGDGNQKFDFDALFASQVEAHNRDWARTAGLWAFNAYKQSGALVLMMTEMQKGIGKPNFEFDILGAVNGFREGVTKDFEVPILGKPDARFISSENVHVIPDWKVNGFCSNSGTSPTQGYINCLDGHTGKPSRSHGKCHKLATPMMYKGIIINVNGYMEDYDTQWADQLATYGWLLGEPVGTEFIVGIDQLACAPSGVENCPDIRVAIHRSRVSEDYQFKLLARYQTAWEVINSDHFFRELTLEESKARCEMLDANELCITPEMSEEEKIMVKLMRG